MLQCMPDLAHEAALADLQLMVNINIRPGPSTIKAPNTAPEVVLHSFGGVRNPHNKIGVKYIELLRWSAYTHTFHNILDYNRKPSCN
jgi:hypothetical protein